MAKKNLKDILTDEQYYETSIVINMISSIIDNHLIQCPVNKLDKDISKFIEEAATNLDRANTLIQNKFNQN